MVGYRWWYSFWASSTEHCYHENICSQTLWRLPKATCHKCPQLYYGVLDNARPHTASFTRLTVHNLDGGLIPAVVLPYLSPSDYYLLWFCGGNFRICWPDSSHRHHLNSNANELKCYPNARASHQHWRRICHFLFFTLLTINMCEKHYGLNWQPNAFKDGHLLVLSILLLFHKNG